MNDTSKVKCNLVICIRVVTNSQTIFRYDKIHVVDKEKERIICQIICIYMLYICVCVISLSYIHIIHSFCPTLYTLLSIDF